MSCLQVFVALVVFAAVGSNGTYIEEKLQDHLFHDYHDHVLPQRRLSDTVDVKFGLHLLSIGEVNQQKQEIEFNFWGNFAWADYRLRWEPKRYGNISRLRVPAKWLWKPDLAAYNSAHDSDYFFLTHEGNTVPVPNAILDNKGLVIYIPPFCSRVRCHFEDVGDGAFRCRLKFGSWTVDGTQLGLSLNGNKTDVDISHYQDPNWEIVSTTIRKVDRYYPCCQEPYPHMEVNITMKAIP